MPSNIAPAVLRTYLAVVETGSLKLAAEAVGRSVAALSYQMSGLETALEKKLFTRSRRGMSLSEEGIEFLSQAKLLLRVHDQIVDKNHKPPHAQSDFLPHLQKTKADPAELHTNRLKSFEDNLETKLFRDVFSIWRSYREEGKELSFEDLIAGGVISLARDHVFLTHLESTSFHIVAASEKLARLFQVDNYGPDFPVEQVWRSPKIFESRRKIFSICKNAHAPVFFSGNAPIPWHSDSYASTIDQFVSTKLDRLLVPVKMKSGANDQMGILQIAMFRNRLNLPLQRNSSMSEEAQAASLNVVGNVAVSL